MTIPQTSRLIKLDPFIHPDGLLRVGGRLKNADLLFKEAHPIILSSRCHITKLVIDACHKGDCFGPFAVKDSRKELKRYGVIFTCMSSRAIHIEMVDDLSTDSFINALRCFIAIRGPIRQLRSDRGTNFVGTANEFAKCKSEVAVKFEQFCRANNFDFVFNTPSASYVE